MNIIEKIEQYSLNSYEIAIEVSRGDYAKYLTDEQKKDVNNFGTYYVNIYYGDSGNPLKAGTKVGLGHGFTLEEAFNNAENDLKLINGA